MCIYIIVQRFTVKYFKYGSHLGELCVTQISKYRDLTHVRQTGQIKCWSTLATYVLIHNPMLPNLNSQNNSIKYLRVIL